jgi:hypothetical protein
VAERAPLKGRTRGAVGSENAIEGRAEMTGSQGYAMAGQRFGLAAEIVREQRVLNQSQMPVLARTGDYDDAHEPWVGASVTSTEVC